MNELQWKTALDECKAERERRLQESSEAHEKELAELERQVEAEKKKAEVSDVVLYLLVKKKRSLLECSRKEGRTRVWGGYGAVFFSFVHDDFIGRKSPSSLSV